MTPELRVTVRRDGIVRAVRWAPHLEIAGPLATLLDTRDRAGVTIADVSFGRDEDDDEIEEIVVDLLAGGDDEARAALVRWGRLVGAARIWFDDDMVELVPVRPHRMETRCGACRLRLVDGSDGLWAWVREQGFFPCVCPICGADLPQWWPVRQRQRPRGLRLVGGMDTDGRGLRVSDERGSRRP